MWTFRNLSLASILLHCLSSLKLSQNAFQIHSTKDSIVRLQFSVSTATPPQEAINPCRIKVVGVGGGGGNAVNRMHDSSFGVASTVDFWIVNTDVQALSKSPVSKKLNIGTKTSRSDPKLNYILLFDLKSHFALILKRLGCWRGTQSRSRGRIGEQG
jgi:hypothetical protein